MMRNSGEENEFSVNFLNGKIKTVTGGNAFENAGNRPRTAWKALTGKRDYYLNAMPDEKDWMRIWGL